MPEAASRAFAVDDVLVAVVVVGAREEAGAPDRGGGRRSLESRGGRSWSRECGGRGERGRSERWSSVGGGLVAICLYSHILSIWNSVTSSASSAAAVVISAASASAARIPWMVVPVVAVAAAVVGASSVVALALAVSWAGRGHFVLGLAGWNAPAEMKGGIVEV